MLFKKKVSRPRNLYPDLEAYIDKHYVDEKSQPECERAKFGKERPDIEQPVTAAPMSAMYIGSAPVHKRAAEPVLDEDYAYDSFTEEKETALEERMKHLADTFQQYLMYLIESKGLTNAQVYKRGIISKQTFSKIKRDKDAHPDKGTAMRLCVGAGLNLDETRDLLARAGYALSPCDKRDVIFSYFIEKGIFDMIEIDIALEEHGLPCFIE